MTLARLIAPALTILACALLWFGYESIDILRGTPLWELRYVLLGCAAFALLTLMEKASARLNAWVKRRDG
jgi:hypothetical protein